MSSPAPRFSWRPTLNHSAIPFLTALLAIVVLVGLVGLVQGRDLWLGFDVP